jgi:hypothetical protein
MSPQEVRLVLFEPRIQAIKDEMCGRGGKRKCGPGHCDVRIQDQVSEVSMKSLSPLRGAIKFILPSPGVNQRKMQDEVEPSSLGHYLPKLK